MSDTENDGRGFLERWSRRKRRVRAGNAEIEPPAPAAEDAAERPVAADREDTPTRLTDTDMPPIDTLGPASDYSGFMSPGVSEDLRRKALTRLFLSPSFNIPDELDDYAEDFTKFAALGDIVTADMRHRMEQQARRLVEDGERLDSAETAEVRAQPETDGKIEDGAGEIASDPSRQPEMRAGGTRRAAMEDNEHASGEERRRGAEEAVTARPSFTGEDRA